MTPDNRLPNKRPSAGLAGLVLAAALAAGCAPAIVPTSTAARQEQAVSVRGKVAIARYGLKLALPPGGLVPFGATDVDRIKVYLSRNDGPEVQLGVQEDVAAPIEIGNLRRNTSYSVRIEAYKAIGDGEWERIDADDARCVTTFVTSDVVIEEGLSFGLALKNKVYSGVADTGLTVAPGDVVDHPESEVLTAYPGGAGELPPEEPGPEEPVVQLYGFERLYGPGTVANGGDLTLPGGSVTAFGVPVQSPDMPEHVRRYRVTLSEESLNPAIRITFMVDTPAALADEQVTGHPALEIRREGGDALAVRRTTVETAFGVLTDVLDHGFVQFHPTIQLDLFRYQSPEGDTFEASAAVFDLDDQYVGQLPAFTRPSEGAWDDPVAPGSVMAIRFENPEPAPWTVHVQAITDLGESPMPF